MIEHSNRETLKYLISNYKNNSETVKKFLFVYDYFDNKDYLEDFDNVIEAFLKAYKDQTPITLFNVDFDPNTDFMDILLFIYKKFSIKVFKRAGIILDEDEMLDIDDINIDFIKELLLGLDYLNDAEDPSIAILIDIIINSVNDIYKDIDDNKTNIIIIANSLSTLMPNLNDLVLLKIINNVYNKTIEVLKEKIKASEIENDISADELVVAEDNIDVKNKEVKEIIKILATEFEFQTMPNVIIDISNYPSILTTIKDPDYKKDIRLKLINEDTIINILDYYIISYLTGEDEVDIKNEIYDIVDDKKLITAFYDFLKELKKTEFPNLLDKLKEKVEKDD